MEDISVKKFKGFELSQQTLEEILKNMKLDNTLSKYGLTSIKSDDEVWSKISLIMNNSGLKKSIRDCYLKVMSKEHISREDMMVLKSKISLVNQIYIRNKTQNTTGRSAFFTSISNSYQKINLSKSDIEFIERSVRACAKYYPNIKNIDEIVDALIIITKNMDYIKSLVSEVFNLLGNLEDFKEEYKSLIEMKKFYFTIPKHTDTFTEDNLSIKLKFDALIRKYGKNKPELTKEYMSKLSSIIVSEDNLATFFNMLIYTDFENKTCNIGKALEYSKQIIENPSAYALEEVPYDNEGYNILDFIKNSSQNLFDIKISEISTKGDFIREIYNILGTDSICNFYWDFKVDGNDLKQEARYNIGVLEDAQCYYYYGLGVSLYTKKDKLDQIEIDSLEKNINHIKRAIDRKYISLRTIYYTSKEIDYFINSNENIDLLKGSIDKINVLLAKHATSISETLIIEKGSPLFPKECKNQYILLSVCCNEGSEIGSADDTFMEDTCMNYLDIDNNIELHKETKQLTSLLRKYKAIE